MYQLKDSQDTIVAISTAAGPGGIGIVRLSGKEALSIAESVFRAKSQNQLSKAHTFTVHYGWIVDGDSVLDEVLLTVMRAPHTYTTEDVVEISCHGGSASLRAIIDLAIDRGARLAEPGEFTKRAFLNGRIDLTQAEAVLDIVHSKTDAFLKVSTNQLKGELSRKLESIREELMSIYVEIEAIVNFPEDEVDAQNRKAIIQNVKNARLQVEQLLSTGSHGRILKDGIKIVLCGKPNAGKSSLLNALLKTPRAIVSDIAGTTRDTIEETAQIKGVPLQLVDTAGLLEPRDLIEEEAIKRSRMYIDQADLVLVVLDSSQSLDDEHRNMLSTLSGDHIFALCNKSDLNAGSMHGDLKNHIPDERIFKVSALTRDGVDLLEDGIIEHVWKSRNIDTHGIMISNLRHIEALKKGRDTLLHAEEQAHEGISFEFISEDVKSTVNFLDSITGRNIDTDLLDTIFSQFCIGK